MISLMLLLKMFTDRTALTPWRKRSQVRAVSRLSFTKEKIKSTLITES